MLTKNSPKTILSVTVVNADDKDVRAIWQSRNWPITYLQSVLLRDKVAFAIVRNDFSNSGCSLFGSRTTFNPYF